jgi:hypothetical protein
LHLFKFPIHINMADIAITGDLKIINNTSLQDVFTTNPKYREPKSINWTHNFKILMDFVKDYARQWTKREMEDLYTRSELVKSVRSFIQIRIKKLSGSMSTRSHQSLKTQMLLTTCLSSMTNMLLSQLTRPLTILFLCVNHIL